MVAQRPQEVLEALQERPTAAELLLGSHPEDALQLGHPMLAEGQLIVEAVAARQPGKRAAVPRMEVRPRMAEPRVMEAVHPTEAAQPMAE